MGKTRLEAFSDGVIAIIITIMVLELAVPHGATLADLKPLWGVFISYVMSFVFIGIYWNNHHHLLHTVHHVTGGILWANLHLLFWLSLVPFATGWMGESIFAPQPTAVYGIVLLMAACAFWILARAIVAAHGPGSVLGRALEGTWKDNASIGLYVVAVIVAWWAPAVAGAIYALVALIWLIPDRRIERALEEHERR